MLAKSSPAALIAKPTPRILKSHIFHTIRDAIISGRYKPGQRLNESQLAREFSISRIPVREALSQLCEHGLVQSRERRGIFVTALSDEDVQCINSLRIILEVEALKLCAANMTKAVAVSLEKLVDQMENWKPDSDVDAAATDLEFHRTIWKNAGNPYLTKTLDSVVPILFAHTALESVNHHVKAWRLHHHRTLLDVVLGKSDMTPEEAVLAHLQIHFKEPERFSSFSTSRNI